MTRESRLDNLVWLLLQLVRSAPLGGQTVTRATWRKGRDTRLKYFTWAQLRRAAQIGFERDYNRQLDLDAIERLPRGDMFPITFSLPHEHIAGKPAPLHMRCNVVLTSEGDTALIDTDLGLYNSLGEFESPNPTRVAAPSAN